MPHPIHIQTPGRICLFGDHQDYLHLPVIAFGINRFIWLKAEPISSPELRLDFPDMGTKREISLTETFKTLEAGDHLGAGIRLMRKQGIALNQGYDIRIWGNLPINAGVSSSSALTVAWMQFLWEAYGDGPLSAFELGYMAYEAEVVEQHAPGGKMDQMSIAYGGLVHIDTQEGGKVSRLKIPEIGLVLANSGVPKPTTFTLGSVKERVWEAIKILTPKFPGLDLQTAQNEDIPQYVPFLPEPLKPVFEAAIGNHTLTRQGLDMLKTGSPDPMLLGALVSRHHAYLRDNLDLSVEPVEKLIRAAMSKGAYGAKIVGSGGGGCVVALCEKGQEASLAEAMFQAGAIEAFPVAIEKGSQVLPN